MQQAHIDSCSVKAHGPSVRNTDAHYDDSVLSVNKDRNLARDSLTERELQQVWCILVQIREVNLAHYVATESNLDRLQLLKESSVVGPLCGDCSDHTR